MSVVQVINHWDKLHTKYKLHTNLKMVIPTSSHQVIETVHIIENLWMGGPLL